MEVLSNPFVIVINSWLIGLIIYMLFNKKDKTPNWVNRFQFIKTYRLGKLLGMVVLKVIILKSPLRFYNPNIKIGKFGFDELVRVQREIVKAEITHIYAWIFSQIIAFIFLFFCQFEKCLLISGLNIVLNLFPILLQQTNKLRFKSLLNNWH